MWNYQRQNKTWTLARKHSPCLTELMFSNCNQRAYSVWEFKNFTFFPDHSHLPLWKLFLSLFIIQNNYQPAAFKISLHFLFFSFFFRCVSPSQLCSYPVLGFTKQRRSELCNVHSWARERVLLWHGAAFNPWPLSFQLVSGLWLPQPRKCVLESRFSVLHLGQNPPL